MGKEAAENQTPALTEVDHRVEKALRLRAEGRSWREIGKELGCDSGNLYRACVARGYNGVQKERRAHFAKLHSEIADEAGRQLLERLQAGEKMTSKELAVIGGISTDKVRDAENWKGQGGGDEGNWLATIASRLKPDQTLELKVSAPPKAIDVTPRQAPDSASELTVSRSGPTPETKPDKPES
jgi:hypothetical protein